MSGLLKHQTAKNDRKKEICDPCLHYFYDKKALDNHEKGCSVFNKCKIKLPDEEYKNINFTNFSNQEEMPFVIYADFESVLKKPVDGSDPKICQVHEAFSLG